jgi:hypothetical protein
MTTKCAEGGGYGVHAGAQDAWATIAGAALDCQLGAFDERAQCHVGDMFQV